MGKYHPDDDYDEKIEKMVTLTVAGVNWPGGCPAFCGVSVIPSR